MTAARQAVATVHNALPARPVDSGRCDASLAVPAVLLVVFWLRFVTSGLTSGAVKGLSAVGGAGPLM